MVKDTRRERGRAAATSDRYLAVFGVVAGAAGALVWLALSLLS
ncbi:MAG TPA: hypothetical protein VLV50_00125 [Stellaceae bacterium]|nr:hypothetical protein [Stellaceae bacterium]